LTDAQLETFTAAAGSSLGPELTRFGTLLEMERIAGRTRTQHCADLRPHQGHQGIFVHGPTRLQEVDITKSLETTLIIMHHKLKRGIAVTRNYDPDLPKIMAYGSELNQVWTNLIDNAADAMGEMASCAFVRLGETISFSSRSPTMVPAFLPK